MAQGIKPRPVAFPKPKKRLHSLLKDTALGFFALAQCSTDS